MTDASGLAMVTGASSGIGRQLAEQFADHGYDLVIVAEGAALHDAAGELGAKGVQVIAVVADLRTAEGVEKVWSAVEATGRPLAAAALNAGVGLGGAFVDQSLDDALGLVNLNVVSTVHLAKRVLDAMVARREGKVLITSSIASEMPGPYQALYNASKSFVQSFSEAVRDELRDSGVTVTAMMPGPTLTNFFGRAGLTDTKLGSALSAMDDPADVARRGFGALMAGQAKVQAGGLATRAQGTVLKVLPDRAKAALHRAQAKPRSGG